jgi:hypothetical protein
MNLRRLNLVIITLSFFRHAWRASATIGADLHFRSAVRAWEIAKSRRVEKPVSGRHPRCELKQFDAITEVGELADHSGGALLL